MITWPIFIIPSCIGFLMGMLYALSGFNDSGKNDDLKANPRVRNLLWIISGAVGVLLADWKIFSDSGVTSEQRAVLVAAYLLAAVVSAAVWVIGIAIGIFANAATQSQKSVRGHAFDLTLTFLSSGYKKYQLSKNEFLKRKDLAVAELAGEVGLVTSSLIARALRDREPGADPANRENTVSTLMEAASEIVQLVSDGANPELRTNYMLSVPKDELNAAKATKPYFTYGDTGRYETYLVLERYRSGPYSAICLPVEPRNSGDRALPGAPHAFYSGEFGVINAKKPPKCGWLPKATQAEIADFFRKVDFQSVLSVPIIKGDQRVGVLNIESSLEDVVGQGPGIVKELVKALAPLLLLLGEVLDT